MLHSWLSHPAAAPAISTVPESVLPSFKYEPLPSNKKCFRIFHLEPRGSEEATAKSGGSDHLHGGLRGHLSIVYLDQTNDTRIQYDALSYCWEDPIEPNPKYDPNDKDIVALHQERSDGTRTAVSQFTITRALSTTLRYLRARSGITLLPPMFIDQICINQGEEAEAKTEKNQQISLMGDIYRHCARVVAWLGVATAQTNAFFDFAAELNHHRCEGLVFSSERPAAVLSTAMHGKPNSVFDADEVLRRDMPHMVALARQYWPAFPHRGALQVYLRRWFRRIWIIQEACLAPDMVFVCGWRSCSVRDFGSVVTFHILAKTLWSWEGGPSPSPSPPPPPCPEEGNDSDTSHMAKMASQLPYRILHERWLTWRPLSPSGSESERRGLAGLVTRFNVDVVPLGPWARLGSSKAHDYIYALKGLASEGDHVAANLVPNYDAPPHAAFTDFTRLVIDPALDTLLLSQMETKMLQEGLPSWVPDYSSEELALPRGYSSGCRPMFAAGCPDGDITRARPQVDVRSRHGILRAKGILLCEIDRVGTHSMELPPPTAREPHYMHLYLGFHMAFPLPWWSRKLSDTSRTPLPRTIFSFFREVREFCELAAATAARSEQAAASTCTGGSFPSSKEEGVGGCCLDEAVWLTSTGGHGLPSNITQSPLGPPSTSLESFDYGEEENKKPLLGRIWDLQLSMDVLPTIMRRRRTSLSTLAFAHAGAIQRLSRSQGFPWLLPRLRASLVYWASRLWIEARHVFWCYRFFVTFPFIPVTSEDSMLWGVLERPATRTKQLPSYDVGLLKGVLGRHVGRCCFISSAGHVGLVPAGTEGAKKATAQDSNRDGERNKLRAMPGDLVVVLLSMSAPIVLRPGPTTADPCTYVGEAYCHGFMNGEALRGKVEADMPWFEIK